MSILGVWSNATKAQSEGDDRPEAKSAPILGTWNATERHKGHGSLYQPNHEARKRDAVIYFEQDGDRLTGRAVTPNYKEIVGQGYWDGKTKLERLRYSGGKLVFEIDIVQRCHSVSIHFSHESFSLFSATATVEPGGSFLPTHQGAVLAVQCRKSE
jgi:hypothetical protein